VKGTATDGASKTSEDVLGEGLFGMFGCDSVHVPSNFYEFFVLSDLMALLVMYGFAFCLEKKLVESNLILFFSNSSPRKSVFQSRCIPAFLLFPSE